MKYINLFLVLVGMVGCLYAMQPDLRVLVQEDNQAIEVQNVCPICLVADLDNARGENPTFVLICGHRFCRECISRCLHQRNMCPLCVRHFERGMHWPLAGRHIDRVNMLNNIVVWTPSVTLTVFFSAVALLIIRKFIES